MTSDNPHFSAAVDLVQARHDIQQILDGLEKGLVRIEHFQTAINLISKAIIKVYKRKNNNEVF